MRGPALAVLLLAAAAAGCYTWTPLDAGGVRFTEYYTDLGPDRIDVSSYPEVQRRRYATFARVCGQCHTLARAVNSPTQTRTYWRFHLARMSLHSRMHHQGPLPEADRQAVLDFLEYDARVRKIEGAEGFRARDEELKRRFDPILERQLRELAKDG